MDMLCGAHGPKLKLKTLKCKPELSCAHGPKLKLKTLKRTLNFLILLFKIKLVRTLPLARFEVQCSLCDAKVVSCMEEGGRKEAEFDKFTFPAFPAAT